MNIFLICKQLTDMIYELKVLDYIMVVFAILLIIYAFVKKKIYSNLRDFIIWPDLIVVVIAILYTLAFLRSPENAFNQYVKTATAFLIYFLGRSWGDDILKNSKSLVVASYLVIYVNALYRIYEFVMSFFTTELLPRQNFDFYDAGALYYYKTDLAVGVIVAMIFIYGMAKESIFKYITIFPVTGILVFSCSARMGQLILVLIYVFFIIDNYRTRKEKNWHITNKAINIVILIVSLLITVFLVLIQVTAIHNYTYEGMNISLHWDNIWENLLHAREVVWWNAMNYFSNQPFIVRATGVDLWSERIRNQYDIRFHCHYLKVIYAIGYIGAYTFVVYIWMLAKALLVKKGHEIKVMTIAFWIMLLLMSFSMEAFEYTQMTWYPFIFAGAVMSGKKLLPEKEKK